jgi:hypothetical protein
MFPDEAVLGNIATAYAHMHKGSHKPLEELKPNLKDVCCNHSRLSRGLFNDAVSTAEIISFSMRCKGDHGW